MKSRRKRVYSASRVIDRPPDRRTTSAERGDRFSLLALWGCSTRLALLVPLRAGCERTAVMKLYPKIIPAIARDVVSTLMAEGDIEVETMRQADAEMDM